MELNGGAFAQLGNDNLICRESFGQPVLLDTCRSSYLVTTQSFVYLQFCQYLCCQYTGGIGKIVNYQKILRDRLAESTYSHVSLIGQIENPLSHNSFPRLYRCTGCSMYSRIAVAVNHKRNENGLTELLIRQCKCDCSVCSGTLLNDRNKLVKDIDQQLVKLYWQSQNSKTILCSCPTLSECLMVAKMNSQIANVANKIEEFSQILIAKLSSLIAVLAISKLSLAIHNKSTSFPSCIDILSCKNCLANQEPGERRPDCSVWLPWLQLRDDWFSGGHVFMSHRCIKKLFNFTCLCCILCQQLPGKDKNHPDLE